MQILISQNRAKFIKNRVVYVTPNGIYSTYDLDDLDHLLAQLQDDGFTCRTNIDNVDFNSQDWFKHGEKDWWESYVITVKNYPG